LDVIIIAFQFREQKKHISRLKAFISQMIMRTIANNQYAKGILFFMSAEKCMMVGLILYILFR